MFITAVCWLKIAGHSETGNLCTMKAFLNTSGLQRDFLTPECMNILFMHLFVYMCHGHFSLSEYVIMLDIDLCRKIPGQNKCKKWTCNHQRVSLWYPAWPPFYVMNSCLAGNFLLENTITSVVYVLLGSSLYIRNCHEKPRYKTLNPDSLSVCWFVCSKSINMWVEQFIQDTNCVNRYGGKGILSMCKCYKTESQCMAWDLLIWQRGR